MTKASWRNKVSRPPPYSPVVIPRPKSPPDFDGWGKRAKKEQKGTKVLRVERGRDVPVVRRRSWGCWSPRVAPGALCESLCALFELSQALCFSVTYGARILARSRYPSAPFGLLFFLRRPLFFSFFLSSCPATFRGHVKRFFFLAFWSCALRERTNWHIIFFPVVSFLDVRFLDSYPLVDARIDSRSTLTTQWNLRSTGGDNPKSIGARGR